MKGYCAECGVWSAALDIYCKWCHGCLTAWYARRLARDTRTELPL